MNSSPSRSTIFLALEPDEATFSAVDARKSVVRDLVGDQLYLSDPPHVTLYLAVFPSAAEVVAAVRELVTEWSAPATSVVGWHVFDADPLAGLNTLVVDFDAESQRRLQLMQTQLVHRLAGLRDEAATLERIAGRMSKLDDRQQQAVRDWGFPFVDDGWHPHITIASIDPAAWPEVAEKLLPTPIVGPVGCPRLKVYDLVDGAPRELACIELQPAAGTPRKLPPADSRDRAGADSGAKLNVSSLKDELTREIWEVVERHNWILSATITGSFLTDDTLAAISDIDLVLVVDVLNAPRFDGLQSDFTAALEPVLAARGLALKINPTLGPRKLNDDATAVLHLMLYSREGHHQHAIKSPFTCLDWQRSAASRKLSLAGVYPVFGLQPHHFVSARRGIRDYLHDFERGVVSYRELECSDVGCEELKREEPMATRDRYEYAYHVMRFLMQNLLKLVWRRNAAPDGELLLREFFTVFPRSVETYGPLYTELRRMKKARDFSEPLPQLTEKLRQFVLDFESQFRIAFHETATRHLVFRHAPTAMNGGRDDARRFVGRINPRIEPVAAEQLAELLEAATDFAPAAAYTSPLARCRQSLELVGANLALPAPTLDERLIEIDYGACDGLEIAEARRRNPATFAAWQRGEDARFPDGENAADVLLRIQSFASEAWTPAEGNTISCTHNVVLRCLIGKCLGVPRREWHRIQVPHLAPITFVETQQFGLFADLEESVERKLFADFLHRDRPAATLAA